jgi:hypothetical protein
MLLYCCFTAALLLLCCRFTAGLRRTQAQIAALRCFTAALVLR